MFRCRCKRLCFERNLKKSGRLSAKSTGELRCAIGSLHRPRVLDQSSIILPLARTPQARTGGEPGALVICQGFRVPTVSPAKIIADFLCTMEYIVSPIHWMGAPTGVSIG